MTLGQARNSTNNTFWMCLVIFPPSNNRLLTLLEPPVCLQSRQLCSRLLLRSSKNPRGFMGRVMQNSFHLSKRDKKWFEAPYNHEGGWPPGHRACCIICHSFLPHLIALFATFLRFESSSWPLELTAAYSTDAIVLLHFTLAIDS